MSTNFFPCFEFADRELDIVQTGLRFHHQLMLLNLCATAQELPDQPAFKTDHMIMVFPLHHLQLLVTRARYDLQRKKQQCINRLLLLFTSFRWINSNRFAPYV